MSDLSDVLEPGINLYARVKLHEIKRIITGQTQMIRFRKAPGGPYIAILSIELYPDLKKRYELRGYEVLSCPASKPLWQKIKRTGATHIHKFRKDTGEVIYVLVMREDQYQEMQRIKKEGKKVEP